MHLSEIWHSKKNDCRLSRTQVSKLDPVLTGDYSSTCVRVLQYLRKSTGKTGFDYTTKIKLKKES